MRLNAFYANDHRIVGRWKDGGRSSRTRRGMPLCDRVAQFTVQWRAAAEARFVRQSQEGAGESVT